MASFNSSYRLISLVFVCVWLLYADKATGCGPYPYVPSSEDTLSFIDHGCMNNNLHARFQCSRWNPFNGMSLEYDGVESVPWWERGDSKSPDLFEVCISHDMFSESQAVFQEWRIYLSRNYPGTFSDRDIFNAVFRNGHPANFPESLSEYLAINKQVNELANRAFEDQRWGEPPPGLSNAEKEKAENLYRECAGKSIQAGNDSFMAVRYGYQAIRAACAAGENDKAVQYYDQLVAGKDYHTITRYYALSWKARALLKTGVKLEALAVYLEVFDQCAPLIDDALRSVNILNISGKEWDGYLSSRKSRYRLMVGYFVRDLIVDRFEMTVYLEKVAQLMPNAVHAESLLVRRLQELEYDYSARISPRLVTGIKNKIPKSYYYGSNDFNAEQGFDRLRKSCEKIATISNIRRPVLWYSVACYLSLLSGNLENARKDMEIAMSMPVQSPELGEQRELISILLDLASSGKVFPVDLQSKIVQYIHRQKDKTDQKTSNIHSGHSLLVLSAMKFLMSGDRPSALLLFASAGGPYALNIDDTYWHNYYDEPSTSDYLLDVILSDNELANLENLLKKKRGTPLTDAVIDVQPLRFNDARWFRGVKALRRLDYRAAAGFFNSLPPDFWKIDKRKRIDGYTGSTVIPVKEAIFTLVYPDVKNPQKWQRMDLATFAETMAVLHEKADGKGNQPSSDPELSMQLGNIYYSLHLTGFHVIWGFGVRPGNLESWADGYYCSDNDVDSEWSMLNDFPFNIQGVREKLTEDDHLYERQVDYLKVASKYYGSALGAGYKDKEVAARICKLLTLNVDYDKKISEKKYLGLLADHYSDTSTYRDLISHCEVFQEYLKKKRR